MRIVKTSLWVALAFALVWAAVISYWRTTNRFITLHDVGIYLVVLPLAMICGYLLFFVGINWLRNRPSKDATLPSANEQNGGNVQPTQTELDARERTFKLAVLGAFVNTSLGTTADEIAGSLAECSRPGLDVELKDQMGFPIFAARAPQLDVEAIDGVMVELTQRPEFANIEFTEPMQRAFALLANPLAESVRLLASLIDAKLVQPEESHEASQILRVILFLPPNWSEPQRQLAAAFVRQSLVEIETHTLALSISTISTDKAMATTMTLDQLSKNLNREALDDFVLALACDSYVSELQVQAWDEEAQLFTAKQKDGLIPGEAAAAILLCREEATKHLTLEKPVAALSRWAFTNRATPIDKTSRVTGEAIKEIADHVRECSALKIEDFGAVVCDVDQRASRMVELAHFMTTALPELDAVKDCACVGVGCGFIGSASETVTLAIAAARAAKLEKPVLVLWMNDSIGRAATVVLPGRSIES